MVPYISEVTLSGACTARRGRSTEVFLDRQIDENVVSYSFAIRVIMLS